MEKYEVHRKKFIYAPGFEVERKKTPNAAETPRNGLNFSFEFEIFFVFAMQILINIFGCFVTATQYEALDTVIAHSNQVIANVLDVRLNLMGKWDWEI